jgi:drug/metabolite transporter (DMT)-like permease
MTEKKTLSNFFTPGFLLALISAFFFSLNVPIAKWLLNEISPYWLASLLYFGAGLGTYLYRRFSQKIAFKKTPLIHKRFWVVLMIVLDIIAPIFFFVGVQQTDGSTVGLLSNTELLFTFLFALFLFKETLKIHTIFALGLIAFAVIINNLNQVVVLTWSQAWILIATLAWGLENNVSKKLSIGDPFEVVVIKGFATGIGTAIITLVIGDAFPPIFWFLIALVLGFIVYGGSLIFYVFSQRKLGATPVQIIQSFAPLVGGLMSMVLFLETIPWMRWISYLLIMIALGLLASESRQTSHHAKEAVSSGSNRIHIKNSIK